MSKFRLGVAGLAVASALMLASTGIASAQVPIEASVEATCDPTTGTYVVTLTIDSNVESEIDLYGYFEAFQGDSEIDQGGLMYTPTPTPSGGTSTATFNVPGVTDYIHIDYGFEWFDDPYDDVIHIDLDGDCVPTPTTTTTAGPTTTTTTTAAVIAAVAAPRFTG